MIERNKEKYYFEALGSLVFVIKQLREFTVILVVSFISVLLSQRKCGLLKLLRIANRLWSWFANLTKLSFHFIFSIWIWLVWTYPEQYNHQHRNHHKKDFFVSSCLRIHNVIPCGPQMNPGPLVCCCWFEAKISTSVLFVTDQTHQGNWDRLC